ncbi:MAG: hypothetical protein R3C49_13130 [Planctomycetaceae bacterium]
MKRLFVSSGVLALAAAVGSGVSAQEDKPAVAVAKPAVATVTPPAAAASKPVVRPLSVTVEIAGGTNIRGTLSETSDLPMRTSFGQASIPLSEVAGIRLASADNATTTVVMHNGDSITGATELQKLVVETEWGKAEITGTSITSILFAQGLQWTSDTGLNGTRWSLAEAPKPAAKPAVTPAAATRPTTPQPRPASNVQPVSGFRVINGF